MTPEMREKAKAFVKDCERGGPVGGESGVAYVRAALAALEEAEKTVQAATSGLHKQARRHAEERDSWQALRAWVAELPCKARKCTGCGVIGCSQATCVPGHGKLVDCGTCPPCIEKARNP